MRGSKKLRLALGVALKLYTCVVTGSKLNTRKFRGIISTFVKVTGEKLLGGGGGGYFFPFSHPE